MWIEERAKHAESSVYFLISYNEQEVEQTGHYRTSSQFYLLATYF